jgi:hypothetical protein
MTTFPWKTVMWINPGSVKVAEGYRADDTILYPLPEAAVD